MNKLTIAQQQAQTLLITWLVIGRDITTLARFQRTGNKINVMIPDYHSNEWYQVGGSFSCYADALMKYGALIDAVSK